MFHSVLARYYEDIVKLQLGETNSTSCGTPQAIIQNLLKIQGYAHFITLCKKYRNN